MFDVLVFVELDFQVLHIIDIIVVSTLADFSYPVLGPLIYLLPDFSYPVLCPLIYLLPDISYPA